MFGTWIILKWLSDVDYIHLVQYWEQCLTVINMVINLRVFINDRLFLTELSQPCHQQSSPAVMCSTKHVIH